MTDAEQIEAWRKEYFDLTKEISGNSQKWQGFLMAKRSQPVIELPETDCHCYDDDNGVNVWSYMPDTVFNAITAAGYKYKVKS